MSIAKSISFLAVATFATFAAVAEEPELSEQPTPSRWHISAGARFAPGVKTKAAISPKATIDAAGRLGGAKRSQKGAELPHGTSYSTERSSATTRDVSSEAVPVTPTSRFGFDPDPDSNFIDMNDTSSDPNETYYWHFDSADTFNEARGSVTGSETTTVRTTDRSSTRSEGAEVSSASSSSSFSETIAWDAISSRDDDVWGGDMEVGYDIWRGERFSLGLGIGATLYRSEDAIRAAGRCYSAASSTRSESAFGRYVTTADTTVETTEVTTEKTTITDPGFAYDGALDDIRNDDGSIGGGTPDGLTNPYGGPNPLLTISGGSIEKTTTVETRRDTTVETTRTFEATGSRSGSSSSRRTINAVATGDVEMEEIRLALRPSWKATDWLELRGSFGVAATRVSVDADTTIFVNGSRFGTVSGDDSEWVFAGLCGLDAVLKPLEWLEVSVGADVRFGGTEADYDAGIVRGAVELARCTFRAGIGISF